MLLFAAEISDVVVSGIGGAGVVSVIATFILQYQSARHKEKLEERAEDRKDRDDEREHDNIIIEQMEQQIKRLDARLAYYEDRVSHMQKELDEYRERFAAMELRGTETPNPAWELDAEGKYVAINEAFARILLSPMKKSRGDILGKTNAEFWPKEVADKLSKLDDAATRLENKQAYCESVIFHESLGPFAVGKAVRIWNGRVIGMYGNAMSMRNKVE